MPEIILAKKGDRHKEFFSQEGKEERGWYNLDCALMLIPFRLHAKFQENPEYVLPPPVPIVTPLI